MADFIPRRDVDVVQFTQNFARQIQADPSRFALSAEQAAAYTADQEAFAAAYKAAVNPGTRGLATVLAKDTARKAVVQQTRELARFIRVQPGVTSMMRFDLGLLGAGGEAAGAGGEGESVYKARGPRLKVSAPGRRVKVSVRRTDGGRRRPADAVGAAVYWFIGEQTPAELGRWHWAGNTTRPEMSFVLPGDACVPGAKLWVMGVWLDRRLQPGQPGTAEYTAVGYGLALAA